MSKTGEGDGPLTNEDDPLRHLAIPDSPRETQREREREREMKISLRLHHQDQNPPQSNHHSPPPPLLLRAKLPVSAFNLPFLSSLSLSPSLPPSLSLRTNLSSGPSLKLSYSPSTTATTSAAAAPFTLSLSSGVGVFGSPIDSPLTISAQFSLNPLNPNLNPSFSLHIKPRFGDFSLKKITSSLVNPNPNPNREFDSFVPIETPGSWKDLNLNPAPEKTLVSGVSVWARTVMPVTKRVAVRFRWGVNFPSDIRKNLPFLSVDKVAIERIDEGKGESEEKKSVADFELLKGMCVSVGRELEDLRRENREMRRCLDEMKFEPIQKQDSGYRGSYGNGVSKRVTKPLPVTENLGDIEGWSKVKKNGFKNNGVTKEPNCNLNGANDLESELQRAVIAASTSH